MQTSWGPHMNQCRGPTTKKKKKKKKRKYGYFLQHEKQF